MGISSKEIEIFRELRIVFNFKELTLFEVGYLLVDLCHLSIIGNLLEDKRFDDFKQLYFPYERYRFPTRYHLEKYCLEYFNNIRIKELSKKSLDILISGLGLVSSIIIPIILHIINKKMNSFTFIWKPTTKK